MKHVIGRVWHEGDEFWLELRNAREGANPYAKQSWVGLSGWSPRVWLARLILAVQELFKTAMEAEK